MIQYTPGQVLDSVALLLRDVGGQVDDEYTRGQTQAAAELLANLASRVAWASDAVAPHGDEVAEVLTEIRNRAGDSPLQEALHAAKVPDLTGDALAEARRWAVEHGHPDLEARIRALADAQLDDALGRLRKPGRR